MDPTLVYQIKNFFYSIHHYLLILLLLFFRVFTIYNLKYIVTIHNILYLPNKTKNRYIYALYTSILGILFIVFVKKCPYRN